MIILYDFTNKVLPIHFYMTLGLWHTRVELPTDKK